MSRFQGDIKVKITDSGARMKFIGGQPVMDGGLENAVLISLFTKPGWWGNDLESEESKKIESNYERQRTIVDLQTINDVRDDAEADLKWIKKIKLASKIEIEVINPSIDQIQTEIKYYPPGQDVKTLLLIKNGLNWINQAIDPAYEEMKDVL